MESSKCREDSSDRFDSLQADGCNNNVFSQNMGHCFLDRICSHASLREILAEVTQLLVLSSFSNPINKKNEGI